MDVLTRDINQSIGGVIFRVEEILYLSNWSGKREGFYQIFMWLGGPGHQSNYIVMIIKDKLK